MTMRNSTKVTKALRIAAAAGVLGALSTLAIGDEVIMRDGTVYTGTVVSRTNRVIEIDTKVHGISTRLTLKRPHIKSIVIGETENTTPGTTTTENDEPGITLPASTEPVEEDKPLKRDGYNLLMEVPLKGGFGDDIYPGGVADSFEWAKENGVTDIVFRINSGGGEIWCSNDIVTLIKEHEDDFTMHMLIESAISASIWPSFACDTITMTPGSDFGGAVVYMMSNMGSAEVDKKMNGIRAAKLETTADANGHESLLVGAMTVSEDSIYAYQEDGKWLFSGTTEGLPKGYETIDGPDTVLTLTAKEAHKYGLVDSMTEGKSLEEFAKVQGIEKWDSAGDIGEEIFEKAARKSQLLRDRMMATLRAFQVERAYLGETQTYMTRGSTLQAMRKHIGSYKRYLKESHTLNMPSMAGSFDDAIDVIYWEAEIKTLMADLRRMRRRGP